MKLTLCRLLPALVLPLLACSTEPSDPGPVEYPETRQVDQVDDYFGVEVADPYRWLEDLDGEETAAWVAAQNAVAEPFLAALPGREAIEERLSQIWNYERWSTPGKWGKRYFYNRNDGLQDQSVVYVAESMDQEGDEPPGRVLLDPNTWSQDGTVALAGFAPSRDGRYVAYAQSDGGSDWRKWKVRNVESGEDTGDLIDFTKFTGVSWMPDNSGFFYSRYPPREDDPTRGDGAKAVSAYFHALGTNQSEDRLVFSQPEHPRRNPYASVSEDGEYLLVNLQEGYLQNAVHYRRIDEPDSAIRPLLDQWDALYSYLVNIGSVFLFETNKDAPRDRIVAVDVNDVSAEANPTLHEVVPEAEDTLSYASAVGGKLVLNYLHDARTVVRLAEPNGTRPATPAGEVELPGIGSAGGFGGRWEDPETYYSYSSFGTPSQIYRYDVATGASTLIRRPAIDAELDGYETEQVFFESRDGTRIPMFITHRTGLEKNGDHPTLLYGYGGFSLPMTPGFSSSRLAWLEMGGVLAIPNLRGGGEYGREWHLAGTKLNKQNVFDDFIAAAEWLIAEGYTSSRRIAIQGGSNGGLLVGATLNQRPDLFAAALPAVGVLDMLRYHLPSANARNWSTDYGLSENEDEFRAQYAYSPLHNVHEGTCYPPTLITTADHDDRVVPWHSFKYAAEMQRRQGCDNPVLILVETRAGHGVGKPTSMQIEDVANQWAFAAWAVGLEPSF
ncbi:MAG: prolyl oligopeptidase family serine peptidase [Acidobacteria bacterium]|nr:prolyl oligopeptidase family serine peptidase [Acidobacteriota bacterium]